MSMLRNVLTYMGLGPDEDYDEGYLSDVDDIDIDLTDDEVDGPEPMAERPREGRRVGRGTADASRPSGDHRRRRTEPPAPDSSDPHAQRERPGWLVSPASPSRDDFDEPSYASDAAERETSAPTRARHGAHDRGVPARGAHDAEEDRLRPLRAVPPRDDKQPDRDDVLHGEGITVQPVGTTAGSVDAPPPPPPPEPEIRLVPPRTLALKSFGDAKELADEFKAVVPVVMDLQDVDRELARRLIDFASGVCYALDGSMEKIASQVFLLIPVGVDVSADERRRLEARPTDRR